MCGWLLLAAHYAESRARKRCEEVEMIQETFISLIYNAALLLALGIIFDAISLRSLNNSIWGRLLTGMFLGLVVWAIMLNPLVISPGIVFDTRSILLSLVGMFFGLIPGLIAATVALIYRIWLGGPGVYMGCSVIIASVFWGYVWNRMHKRWKHPFGFGELYLLGIVTHVTMLVLMILLPATSRFTVLHTLALPIMIIYPLVTVLLGRIMVLRIKRKREQKELQESEEKFRSLYEKAPMAYQSLDAEGRIITVNQAWLKTMDFSKEEVLGKNFSEFLPPEAKEHFAKFFPKFKAAGHIDGIEHTLQKKDGSKILVTFDGKIVYDEDGGFKQTQCVFTDVTERRKQEQALRAIEWMLSKQEVATEDDSPYGDLTELNTSRLILDSVGKDVLRELVSDYLSLLDTSSAVYELNGDYAMGIFSSTWCSYLDSASRDLCNTADNREALNSGKWICHEACWNDVSRKAIETALPVDFACPGALHLYAVPIIISTGVIGAINLGYGSPPQDEASLRKLAATYQVDYTEMQHKAAQYQTRPAFIIEQAKRKLHTAAKIIAEIVERKLAENEMKKLKADWEIIFQSIPHPAYILDKDQTVIAANAYLEEAMGLSSEEMQGKKCWELMHGEDTHQPPKGCPFAESCALDNNASGEMEVKALGGWFLITCKPIYDADGQIDRVIHIAMDITQRKNAELILAESEEKYRLLAETAKDIIIVHHMDGSLSYANQIALDFFGIGAESMPEMNILDSVAPEYHAMLTQHAAERAQGFLGSRMYQLGLIDHLGKKRQVEVSSTPIVTDNAISGILAVIRDITERIADQIVIKESEEKYRSLVDSSDSVIAMLDESGVIHFANRRAADCFEISEADFIGRNMADIFPPEMVKFQMDVVRQVIQSGKRKITESCTELQGRRIWYHSSVCPVLDANGKAYMVVVNATDITQVKESARALKESQVRFEMFMNNLPGGAFIKDKESRVLYVNQYLKKTIHGWNTLGKAPWELYDAELADAILTEDREVLESGILHAVEDATHNDGSLHFYDTTKFLLSNPHGDPLIGGIALDVTERKLAEEQRNRYAHRLEILRRLDSIVLETLSFDSVCNTAVKSLQELIPFNVLSVNVLTGDIVHITALLKPEHSHNYLQVGVPYKVNTGHVEELKQSKTIIFNDVSVMNLPPDMPVAEKLITEGMQSFMYNAMLMQDEMVGMLWFISDKKDFFTSEYHEIAQEFANQLAIVLHHLQLIDKIRQHADELELKVEERTGQLLTANQELETFSYTVAHDLRSPLRTIDGYCNMLLEDYYDAMPEAAGNLLNTIRNTSHRMDTLIKELLELARLNRNSLKHTKIDMHKMASEISDRVMDISAYLPFELQIDELHACEADYALISQVWQNLMENAIKFTLPCVVRSIHIGCFKRETDTVYYVKDSGVGFEMQYVDKIFVAFQRLHREKDFEGTGIGLAIVKKIVDRHGGEVWAESAVGKGATIYFSLPDVHPEPLIALA